MPKILYGIKGKKKLTFYYLKFASPQVCQSVVLRAPR